MLGILRERRGRKAAVRTLAPFVERSRQRLTGIPDDIWMDPYIIGFICTVITVAAKREVESLGTRSLGLVQTQAWADITGLSAAVIGEEISFLSMSRNGEFLDGCRRAISFIQVLHGAPPDGSPEAQNPAALSEMIDALDGNGSGEDPPQEDAAFPYGATPDELWTLYFDTPLAGLPPYIGQPRSL
jgi:hypothetical protein